MEPQTESVFEAEFASDERTDLLHQLDDLFQNRPVPRELWACLWLSDLEQLRSLVRSSKDDPEKDMVYLAAMVDKGQVAKHWRQKIRSQPTSQASTPKSSRPAGVLPFTPLRQADTASGEHGELPSTPPSGGKRRRDEQVPRSKVATELCRERDGDQCLITEAGRPVEIAHIFPYAMRNEQSTAATSSLYSPWKVLRMFWTQERVDAWYNAVAPTTENVKNLFCLAPSVHKYHENAYFGLKPLGMNAEKTTLTVRFAWLPCMNNQPEMRISMRPSFPPVTDLRKDDDGGVVGLWNVRSKMCICTGHEITMRTSDSERLPLPDSAILDMQWILQCLAALSAGAEPLEEPYDDDDDDYPYGIAYDDDMSDLSLSEGGTVPSSPLQEEPKANASDDVIRYAFSC